MMEWKKEVGDFVAKGELLAVVETDKVTVDLKASEAGIVEEVLAKVDETIQKGQPLVKLASGAPTPAVAAPGAAPAAEAAPTAPAAGAAPSSTAAAATAGHSLEVVVKDFGAESITEGTLMEWKVSVGDFAAKNELLAVIETDKVTIEVKAEEAGIITELLVKLDETVEAGKAIAKMEAGGAPTQAAQAAPTAAASAPAVAAPPAAAAAAGPPLTGLNAAFARLAALRAGLPWPPQEATGSAAPAPVAEPAQPAKPVPAAAPPTPSKGKERTERRVPMTPMRQRVIQRMMETKDTAALLTTFQEADLSTLLEVCSKHQGSFEKKHGVSVGVLSFFTKASACALQEVPAVNAVIDDSSKETVFRDNIDISVPIPSPRGPVSCVLPGVDTMTIRDIEHSIHDLMGKARKDELAVKDMVGATFGITDTGIAGGMLGTAIINPPQSAVLGTNAVTKRAVVADGKVVARPVMYLSLTYDHRLIDGREAVTFLCSVRDKMEDPTRMLLDL